MPFFFKLTDFVNTDECYDFFKEVIDDFFYSCSDININHSLISVLIYDFSFENIRIHKVKKEYIEGRYEISNCEYEIESSVENHFLLGYFDFDLFTTQAYNIIEEIKDNFESYHDINKIYFHITCSKNLTGIKEYGGLYPKVKEDELTQDKPNIGLNLSIKDKLYNYYKNEYQSTAHLNALNQMYNILYTNSYIYKKNTDLKTLHRDDEEQYDISLSDFDYVNSENDDDDDDISLSDFGYVNQENDDEHKSKKSKKGGKINKRTKPK